MKSLKMQMKKMIIMLCISFFVISCKEQVEISKPLALRSEIIDSIAVEELIRRNSNSNPEYDLLLDEYDSAVSSYIIMYKKTGINNSANNRKRTALLKNIAKVQKKIQVAKEHEELSLGQINRFYRIKNKVLKVRK